MPIPSGDAVTFPAQPGLHAPEQSQAALFARNGEYWTLSYAGVRFTVRDAKGLNYIQRLLQHPGEEFHALDLLGASAATAVSGERIEKHESSLPAGVSFRQGLSGDSGEMLDTQAKQQYRRRLVDLNQDMEEFRQKGDIDRADALQSEIDFLKTELSRAVGLGGRDRRAGSAAERARLSVTRAIKVATQKISEHHVALGELLGRCVRTGSFCSYIPAQRVPISWQFSVEGFAAYEGPKSTAADPARTTSLVKRETGLLQSFTHGTTFVGRETEFALLRHSLQQSLRGEGRVMLISGSPGVGKTRIAAEIGKEASNLGALMFVGGCYDREDSVPFIPFVEMLEVALARAPSSEAFRESLGKDAPEIARLLPELRRLFPDIPAAQELPPEQSRRALFNAVSDFFVRMATQQLVLLFFDDLHWADEGTLSLLNHLARSVAQLPVLIVAAYRDTETDPQRSLAKALDEFIHLQVVHRVHLDGLQKEAVFKMLSALSGRTAPEYLADLIFKDTEGNPFFVEELFRHLVEQGRLFDSAGEFRRDLKPEGIDLPRTVRLVIGRRLARLSDEAQKVLSTAGIIGCSFTFRLLEASTSLDADQLLDRVEEAERTGLINSTVEYPEVKFHFSHELVRRATTDSVSSARRQRIHLNVADAIQHLYGDTLDDRVEDLAHHLWQAGVCAHPLRTSTALAGAAQRALAQSAYDMAADYSKKALKSLERHTEGSDRNGIELSAQVVLGNALMATHGYAAPEVEMAFARARSLCQVVDQSSSIAPIAFGLFMFYVIRGQYDTAQGLGEQLLELAGRERNSTFLLDANILLGGVCFYRGQLSKVREHLQCSIAMMESETSRGEQPVYAQDRAVYAFSWLAFTLWALGYPEQALACTEKSIAISTNPPHPLSRAMALTFDAILHQHLNDPDIVQRRAEESLAISTEYELLLFSACDMVLLGWAMKEQGYAAEGLRQSLAGLQRFLQSGTKLSLAYYLNLIAEIYCDCGKFDEGFKTIAEAKEAMKATGERMFEAEIYRVEGLLVSKCPDRDQSTAEDCLLKSIESARRQESRSFELRAAISLAELWIGRGRGTEARTMLTNVYSWFTEGLETLPMRKAAELLRFGESRS